MTGSYFEFFCPVKIVAGFQALEHIPYELSVRAAHKPLIVTDRGVRAAGLVATLQAALNSGGVGCELVFDEVPQDSSTRVVTQLAQLYRREGCDALIAIGGGSVIDTAKAANILASEGGDDLQRFCGASVLKRPLRPLFVLPTTSGTGSEVTNVSVIKDDATGAKWPFISQFLLPDVAVLDPRMTLGLPPYFTAATAMDAMTHAVEAYTCLGKNPVSDAYAIAAIQKIAHNIEQLLDDPTDKARRLELALAATMAGIAFSNSMCGLVHALGHSVGVVCHVPHGVCMSILLPYVLEHHLAVRRSAIAELLLPLTDADTYAQTRSEERPAHALRTLFALREKLWQKAQLPRYLQETGRVERSQLSEIARLSLDDGALIMNPVEVHHEEALAILTRAFAPSTPTA